MSTHEAIANKVVSIIKNQSPIFTDGNALSTNPAQLSALSRKANAHNILTLADELDVSFNEDGTLNTADVWLTIEDTEVCIDTLANKVHVGRYYPFELSYSTDDDALGLYDRLLDGDYV